MPTGAFAVLLPLDADYKILGYYFKDGKKTFELSNDLFLRLHLDHSKSDYNVLKLKDHKVFSYIYNFEGKLVRKASGIIVGLLLNETEKPEKFRSTLKEASEAMEVLGLNLLKMEQNEFESILKDIYLEHLEPLIDSLKPDVLKESIITTTKLMLSGGKDERKIAQELLKRVEAGEHEKVSEFFKTAESSLKELDYDKAAKFYKKASNLAEELYCADIADSLNEKAKFCESIPELQKRRDKLVQEARTYLRNEDFNSAYLSYKEASDLSKKLVDFEKEEEYRLKSKALEDFYKVDEKYKKK
ncbi:MAG: hypothetical protein EAX89_00185 [Candidatus Lokiarchaeota archaeon]|nr:hypothetical protein [Candidatus Lokiarchaeota archaeon]